MKRFEAFQWLGLGVLGGAILVTGCKHSRCQPCECECQPVANVVLTPERSEEQEVKPVAHIAPKKETATSIQMPVVVPESDASSHPVTGTMSFTAAEAAAMSVKPGYPQHPDALHVPTMRSSQIVKPAELKKTDAVEE